MCAGNGLRPQNPSDQPLRPRGALPASAATLAAVLCLAAGTLHAGGPVSAVDSHFERSTPFQYSADGVNYLWGVGQDQILDGFYFGGHHHSALSDADKVLIRRVDIPGVATGEPCGVFAEFDDTGEHLVSGYPRGDDGNCSMEAMLAGRVINRGTLDTFSNTGPAPKNIERIDFLYAHGLLSSIGDAGLDLGGHIVAEKRGNNPLQIAAITALDADGNPSAYGPLVRVQAAGCNAPDICYGVTPVRHAYSFLQSASLAPQGFARRLNGETENMAVAFVSQRDLALAPAQRYFGFSLFGRDVDAAQHQLLDPASYPRDTADNFIIPGDGADLYGGVASTYWDDDAAVAAVRGEAFIDQNDNGALDAGDVGLAGLAIALYRDSDGDGRLDPAVDQRLALAFSGNGGLFHFPGLADGAYFAELEIESGAALPAGVHLPAGANPVRFEVLNANANTVRFAFSSLSDDGALQANADAVTLRQDTQASIDVLANDSDPVGAGLSIAALGAPAHGSVAVSGGQVIYTPGPGFHGSDSFSYTAADGSGAQSTATVAVTVLRFSDINDNDIDDYEECGCTDIRLLTGLHGAGVGGGGNALWLLALAVLPPLRRLGSTRRKPA